MDAEDNDKSEEIKEGGEVEPVTGSSYLSQLVIDATKYTANKIGKTSNVM